MTAHHLYRGFGTGAVKKRADSRDRRMHHLRKLRAVAAAGPLPPADSHLIQQIKGTYNQGQLPACSAFAAATMKSVQDEEEHGAWDTYEALEAYHDCGGNDREGVDPRAVLELLKAKGLRIAGSESRRRIGTYAFAPKDSAELFVHTLKASIVAGQPFIFSTHLPAEFGWDSAGAPGDPFHELTGVAFEEEWLVAKNTWGQEWGNDGLCRLRWSFLTDNNFQGGDVDAYTCVDALDDALPPIPAPVIVTPPPVVVPFTVNGYLGYRSQTPQMLSAAQMQIVGGPFDVGVIQAQFCGHALEIVQTTAHLLTVKLPRVAGPCVGPVIVQREAVKVVGPLLVLRPA